MELSDRTLWYMSHDMPPEYETQYKLYRLHLLSRRGYLPFKLADPIPADILVALANKHVEIYQQWQREQEHSCQPEIPINPTNPA